MSVESFIASRIKNKGAVAMSCIAISALIMIVSIAVSAGFRSEIKKGISEISGDIQLTPANMDFTSGSSPIERHPSYLERLMNVRGVREIRPVVYRTGIVKAGDQIHGVMLKGVTADSPFCPSDTSALSVSVPSKLARMLRIAESDKLTAYFVSEKVSARTFVVTDIHESILQADDKLIVYARIEDMQRLNRWTEGEISAFEVFANASANIADLTDELGFIASAFAEDDEEGIVARSVLQNFPQIFDWLNLIDFNVLFILALMLVVAGVNMISGLLILLFEHISTIGLLKSLGMRDPSIAKVFLISSSVLVLKGLAIGNVLAIIVCLVQQYTKIISLDPANYFVKYVPVRLDFLTVVSLDAIAFLVIMLLLLIPSLFISKIDPARTMRVN